MSRKIILDIGNTRSKLAFLDKNMRPAEVYTAPLQALSHTLQELRLQAGDIIACASVAALNTEQQELLQSPATLIQVNGYTPTGLQMGYETPDTLGPDRYMAATGAFFEAEIPQHTLVVDFGTCIKYDFVSAAGIYMGGAISPGWDMRFKAMHTFTGKLPLLEIEPGKETPSFIGKNTLQSMQNGVYEGITGELRHILGRYREAWDGLNVFFTGGYAGVFVNKMENNIFVRPNLVLSGLAHVIRFNQK